jgi:hypothetical protein
MQADAACRGVNSEAPMNDAPLMLVCILAALPRSELVHAARCEDVWS